jgi:hypothetical protein
VVKAVGHLIGFIGAGLLFYGVFELNKFIGAGLLLFSVSQAAIRYVESQG